MAGIEETGKRVLRKMMMHESMRGTPQQNFTMTSSAREIFHILISRAWERSNLLGDYRNILHLRLEVDLSTCIYA